MEFKMYQNIGTLAQERWFIDDEQVTQEEYTHKIQERFEGNGMYCNSSVNIEGYYYVHRCSIVYLG